MWKISFVVWFVCLFGKPVFLSCLSHCPSHLRFYKPILRDSSANESGNQFHRSFFAITNPDEWCDANSAVRGLQWLNIHVCFSLSSGLIFHNITTLIFNQICVFPTLFVNFIQWSFSTIGFHTIYIWDKIENPAINWWVEPRMVLVNVFPELGILVTFVCFNEFMDDFYKAVGPPLHLIFLTKIICRISELDPILKFAL